MGNFRVLNRDRGEAPASGYNAMPYVNKAVKKSKENERRKRLRLTDPVWADKERALRRAQMKRTRQRLGVAQDTPRKLKMSTDPKYAAKRRESKAAHNRASNKRCRARKNADWAQWRANKIQRTPVWADLDQIKAFYRLAAAFTKLYTPHHVDHIYPLNGELVSGLQVLPFQDNLRKGNSMPRIAEAA